MKTDLSRDNTGDAVMRILRDHTIRYPRLQIQDVYKLLLQSALGAGHAVHDKQAARDELQREIVALRPDGEGHPLDIISPDGRIARIHLQPYLKNGGSPTGLLEAFVRTANEFHGEVRRLEEFLSSALQLTKAGRMPFSARLFEAFIDSRRNDGYPALAHSPEYQSAYHPAYRVVAVEFLQGGL